MQSESILQSCGEEMFMHSCCVPGSPNGGASASGCAPRCPPARVLMCAGRGGSGAASADVQTGTEAIPPSREKKE